MKNFGKSLIGITLALLLGGGLFVLNPAGQPSSQQAREVDSYRLLLESCEQLDTIKQQIGDAPTGCAEQRVNYQEKLADLPQQNSSLMIVGLILFSLSPMTLILGTILFAAGRIEDMLLTLSANTLQSA